MFKLTFFDFCFTVSFHVMFLLLYNHNRKLMQHFDNLIIFTLQLCLQNINIIGKFCNNFAKIKIPTTKKLVLNVSIKAKGDNGGDSNSSPES